MHKVQKWMKRHMTEDVGRPYTGGGSWVPDEAPLLKIFRLSFLDLGELQTWLKEITTGTDVSFRCHSKGSWGGNGSIPSERWWELASGRGHWGCGSGKGSKSLRTWQLDVRGSGGEKLGIKNDFQVSNLDDCVDGVPPTEIESTREWAGLGWKCWVQLWTWWVWSACGSPT